jgi:hypothetical protein
MSEETQPRPTEVNPDQQKCPDKPRTGKINNWFLFKYF